jgi:hypothetical protein
MFRPARWVYEAWIPVCGGLVWLWSATSFGIAGFLVCAIPGCLLLSSGVSALLYPGDPRIPQFVALGGVVGVPLALPAFFVAGPSTGLTLTVLSAASFIAAGIMSVRQEPHTDGVPRPEPSLRLAAQVAVDDAILAHVTLRHPTVGAGEQSCVRREINGAREMFRDRGWLEAPARYHATPPALADPPIHGARCRGLEYEHVQFDSGYEPHAGEPGRERWLSYGANRTAHAWVLRHRSGPRPWLVCYHGYQMGFPVVDFPAFHAARLHHRLGLNVILPVLPLHGPRKIGRRSGDGFISGDFLDTVHAEAQAVWEFRRLVSWIRAQGAAPIGVSGLSLGGYNAALVACFEDLACTVPGVPATDFTRLTWRHGAPLQIRYAEHRGIVHDEVSEVLRVVSPLVLEPRVPKERRYIFAAIADRLVPAEQARNLWQHWDRPRIVWYQGAHVTFRLHRAVDRMMAEALRESGLVA